MRPHASAGLFLHVSIAAIGAALAPGAWAPAAAQETSAGTAAETDRERRSVTARLGADPAEPLMLAPVTITGEKLERSLEETAASVDAFTAADIEARVDAEDVTGMLEGVPNLLYLGTVGAPIIRGQDSQGPNSGSTAFFGGTVPRATINLDGHYLSYNEYVFGVTSIWDVERIEVFRGPQTTSQGANSIAGAIIVDTKDPTFFTEGAGQVEYGSYSNRRVSLMASGPLTSQVAGRATIDYFGRETFIKYTNPAYAKGDTDLDFSSLTARGKLLWLPQALPELEAKLTYSFNKSNRPTSESASAPFGDLKNATASMPSWKQTVNTVIGDVAYDFSNGMTLLEELQFTDLSVDRVAEPADNGGAHIDQQNYSSETRLTFGNAADRVRGVGGLFLAQTDSDELLLVRGASRFDDTKRNLGVFGETSIDLAERWTLTLGLRYQRDQVERKGTSPYAAGVPLSYDQTFDAWLPKVSLAYEAAPGVTVGGLVTRGYNPGGVNLSFATADYITFKPETVWDYELFGRASLMDDRLWLSANLFYSMYDDAQRLLPDYLDGVQYGSVVVNAADATAYGLELEADWQALDVLRLRGGLGLLATDIGKFSSAVGTSYEGNEFGGAPGAMVSLGFDWSVNRDLTLSADWRYVNGYYSTDENDPLYEVDAYSIANLRLVWQALDTMQLYAFVDNVFDERAATYKSDDRSVGGIVARMTEPRTVGVGLRAAF